MPTRAPELPHGDLFKRGFTTLCGYVNGVSSKCREGLLWLQTARLTIF